MQIGIFAKTFVRPTLEATLDAVIAHDLHCVQFNMACAGLASLPDDIDGATCDRIRSAMNVRGLTIAAVSGTFNMIHPDLHQRQGGLRRLNVLAAACQRFGTRVITLCTGTRDPDQMWRWHPENSSPEAWRDLIVSLGIALQSAQEHDVVLGVEPEISNVIDTARKARRLLDEMQSSHLKIVMDAANLFHAGELPVMRQVLDQAFDLLGSDIVLAHAKDLSHDGEAGREAAGTGMLDYDRYIGLLHRVDFDGALILHGLREDQVDASVAFLRDRLATH
jgi:sugar phosphate isomerase/epimerase